MSGTYIVKVGSLGYAGKTNGVPTNISKAIRYDSREKACVRASIMLNSHDSVTITKLK